MAINTWTGAVDCNWTTPGNWSLGSIPQAPDDVALIPPGTPQSPTISNQGISCAIIIGQSDSGTVALNAISSQFNAVLMTILAGEGNSALDVSLSFQEETSFAGEIKVIAPGSTITMASDATGLTFADNAFVLVAPGSTLNLTAGTFNTGGILEIEGAVSIAAGVNLGGSGVLMIDNGGQLEISGGIGEWQQIAFADGTGRLTLIDPGTFQGIVGFAAAGGRIFLPGINAQSAALAPEPGLDLAYLMTLHNSDSDAVTQFYVQLLDNQYLSPVSDPILTPLDFAVMNVPNAGTTITYTPQGIQVLEQSLPVTLFGAANTSIPLSTIFKNAFGTETPGFYGITLPVQRTPTSTSTDQMYWYSPPVAPAWLHNGTPIPSSRTIDMSEISAYSLRAGNNIWAPAQFQAQVTQASSGPKAEVVVYTVWTADPFVQQGTPGLPKASDVVNAAAALNTAYPNVPNNSLCNWIADCVAAAANVPMPLPDAQLDPIANVAGGFWRIFYRGTGEAPYQDWQLLIQRGDIVRMSWFKSPNSPISGHSTTVMAAMQSLNGPMTVYDNCATIPGTANTVIAEHQAHYWKATNPASITIYRLDAMGQYLICGSALSEVIQGSVHDDLIYPGGGADIITTGPGNNEIQGKMAELAAISVTDFSANDVLNFTDLDSSSATVSFNGDVLYVFESGSQVAAIPLPGIIAGSSFTVVSNTQGGTLISLRVDAYPIGRRARFPPFTFRRSAKAPSLPISQQHTFAAALSCLSTFDALQALVWQGVRSGPSHQWFGRVDRREEKARA